MAPEVIERRIYLIRGQKVMLDSDLAELYGVETKHLNQAVKRHARRFPLDFMFRLTLQEATLCSRSRFVTLKKGQNVKYAPYAFTEQGVAMLSSVLNSDRAVQVNIAIMRAFVKLRELMASHRDLAAKLYALEQKYDAQFRVVFDAIRKLMEPAAKPRRRIGFVTATPAASDGSVPAGPAARKTGQMRRLARAGYKVKTTHRDIVKTA
ncbi:MAG: ORF6N domain-containing protein [Bryobacteraceae bacterium]